MADGGNFAAALPIVLKAEGGYVNDPADPGGETNLGVTKAVWQAWCAERGLPVKAMRDLTVEDVGPLYQTRYWLAASCDKMPWPLALIHFDAAVNSGVTQAAKLLQRALQVSDDGVLGPVTLGKAAKAEPPVCYRYLLERVWFYRGLAKAKPVMQKFLAGGWLARLQDLYRELTIS